MAVVANGTPLSERMIAGRAYSWKSFLQHGLCAHMSRRAEPLTTEDEPGAAVGDGQRITVLAIAGLELPLEVNAPSVIGRVHRLGGLPGVAGIGASSPAVDQPVPGEEVRHGGSGRPRALRLSPPQNRQQLLGPPERVIPAQLKHRPGDVVWRLARAPVQKVPGFYELRVYTAQPGKRDALRSHFRCEPFPKSDVGLPVATLHGPVGTTPRSVCQFSTLSPRKRL